MINACKEVLIKDAKRDGGTSRTRAGLGLASSPAEQSGEITPCLGRTGMNRGVLAETEEGTEPGMVGRTEVTLELRMERRMEPGRGPAPLRLARRGPAPAPPAR